MSSLFYPELCVYAALANGSRVHLWAYIRETFGLVDGTTTITVERLTSRGLVTRVFVERLGLSNPLYRYRLTTDGVAEAASRFTELEQWIGPLNHRDPTFIPLFLVDTKAPTTPNMSPSTSELRLLMALLDIGEGPRVEILRLANVTNDTFCRARQAEWVSKWLGSEPKSRRMYSLTPLGIQRAWAVLDAMRRLREMWRNRRVEGD